MASEDTPSTKESTDLDLTVTDEASFEQALTALLNRAESNGVDISDRHWTCVLDEHNEARDVLIASVRYSDDE